MDLPVGYLSRAAAIAGVTRQAVALRVRRGWPLHALHLRMRPDEPTDLDRVNALANEWGLLRQTEAEKARLAGFAPHVLRGRRKRGWSEDRALTTPVQQAGVRPGSIQDRFNREAAPGVYYGLVMSRVYSRGWTLDRALSTPVQSRGRKKT